MMEDTQTIETCEVTFAGYKPVQLVSGAAYWAYTTADGSLVLEQADGNHTVTTQLEDAHDQAEA